MGTSSFSDLALRSAVNMATRELSSTTNQIETIKSIALKRITELTAGNSDNQSSSQDAGSLESTAIQIAMKILETAYQTIIKQLEVLHHQRLTFDLERQAGIATFTLPTQKEETNLSTQEKIFKSFIHMAMQKNSLVAYFGIHYSEPSSKCKDKFYSVLPFYRLSESLYPAEPIHSNLTRQRTELELFFKSALPETLADIDIGFQKDSRFVAFWESAIHRANYLNDRRLPRFIMMSLSNVLWNLQHPVDPRTGLPLSNQKCIKLCQEISIFMNQLLSQNHAPYLQHIQGNDYGLYSFLRKVEIHVKAMQAAYIEEQLHELKLEDLTKNVRLTQLFIGKNLFKLLYKKYNPITKLEESDEKAAEKMAYLLSYLNQLLNRTPQIINFFRSIPGWIPREAELNKPAITLMDIIILLCHLSWRERDHLLKPLQESKIESYIEFASILKQFDKQFIKPIKQVSKEELHASAFKPKLQEVAELTAQRLVPFITLIAQAYQLQVDTTLTYATIEEHRNKALFKHIKNGLEQLQSINQHANNNHSYYMWNLTPFLPKENKIAPIINELPKRQLRLILIAELLDNLCDIMQHYHSFIQNKLFQTFLLKCLKHIKEEYAILESLIEKIENDLNDDQDMSRHLKTILAPMMQDISKYVKEFHRATENVERVIRAPDFSEEEGQQLSSKLLHIAKQYFNLFAEQSGIEAFLEPSTQLPIKIEPIAPITKNTQEQGNIELSKRYVLLCLVKRCYQALSNTSKNGHKGLLLRELISLIELKSELSEHEMRHIIMELARITASYRETWLFHAPYGQTRSAKALINAVKDGELNHILPIADVLFNATGNQTKKLSDQQILRHLMSLREYHYWPQSVDDISSASISISD